MLAALLVLLFLAGCTAPPSPPPSPSGAPRLALTAARFADLAGWADDGVAAALPAFARSCAVLGRLDATADVGPAPWAGRAADWRAACAGVAAVPPGDDAAARRFFVAAFVPFAIADGGGRAGLFTGYYEPELAGSRRRGGRFTTPLLRRPADLVTVDLGRFRPAWRGEQIAGRVVQDRLEPYETRAEIEAGALADRALEIAWIEDPVDAFFLQIQGSGRLRLAEGRVLRLGYDGQNGWPYVAIGRLLVERGALARDQVSMAAIRAWIAAHPAAGRALMDENPSYVFFRALPAAPDDEGPLGSEGVALTAGRSLAVDRAFLPLGAPVWLDLEGDGGDADRRALRRLMVAQDTGAAIRGPLRGDVFWGHGAAAEARAGAMRAQGRAYLLLPAGLAARLGGATAGP